MLKLKKKRVAIFFGGNSTEHKISLLSSIHIIKAINEKKYEIILIGIDKKGRWMLFENKNNYLIQSDNVDKISLLTTDNILFLAPGNSKFQLINIFSGKAVPKIDIAFSLLHGNNGENGAIQGVLKILNIPFVGTDILGSALCIDKDFTKRILRYAGISVTPYITCTSDNIQSLNFNNIICKFGLPIFIKPAKQGSSIGISKVFNKNEFYKAIELAYTYDSKILIEPNIIGRELEVAILGKKKLEVSCCGEIIVNNNFYTYNKKYIETSNVKYIIPAKIDNNLSIYIKNVAKSAYLALECNIMARIDFFLLNDNSILLNEVNTIPGFTLHSMYPKLWQASGISYSKLIDKLINITIE